MFTADLTDRVMERDLDFFEIEDVSLFDRAVGLIKVFEGWHGPGHWPYVGYGHRVLSGESFDCSISEGCADSLLRCDLLRKCSYFSGFGGDSLILGVLAYNVGEHRVLRSKLIGLLGKGDRNVYREYVSFCYFKGKVLPSLRRRREIEFESLFRNN